MINEATPESILNMPDLKVGEKSSNFLHIIHAVTKMAFKYRTIKITPVLARNWKCSKKYMSQNVHKVKHWKIICGDYSEAPDIVATWFIDPPYRYDSGEGYNHGSKLLNYEKLASWTLERKGQIIFCEGDRADYLPFNPLITLTGVAGKRNKERIFHCTNITNAHKIVSKNTTLDDFYCDAEYKECNNRI